MGGPLVGMMTALIAGATGFCLILAALQQLLRGLDAGGRRGWEVWSIKVQGRRDGQHRSVFLTAEAEILQMVIILMISKPLSAGMELVGKIASR